MSNGSARRKSAWRAGTAIARFCSRVLIVGGVMLLIQSGLILLWQEPISALLTARAQAGLERDLTELSEQAAADSRSLAARAGPEDRVPTRRQRVARLAVLQERRAASGEAIGSIEMPSLGASYTVVSGSGTSPLRKGPGHYRETPLPGRQGTFAVAGHRTTHLAPFRDIDQLERGDEVVIRMPYAKFLYRVSHTRIVSPAATWVKRSLGRERLVLTACHPAYSLAERIVVFAELDRFWLN